MSNPFILQDYGPFPTSEIDRIIVLIASFRDHATEMDQVPLALDFEIARRMLLKLKSLECNQPEFSVPS